MKKGSFSMKKGSFRIKKRTENGGWTYEEKEGFYSDNFGIFKTEENIGYSVTHLLTGLRLSLFDKLCQARVFVKEVESADWPVPWNSSKNGNDYRANANKALEMKYRIQREV